MSLLDLSNDQLADHINAAAAAGPGNIDNGTRKKLLLACENLRDSFETPFEFGLRILLTVRYI